MSPSHVRVRTRALALLAAFVLTTPSALAEPRTPEAPLAAPVVVPNTVPLALARPPAPIDLVDSGGGFVAAGGISARREPAARKFPGTVTELTPDRTEFSTVVANPDGTFTETLALGRLNYKDAKGAWQPIDVKLVTRAIDTYSLGMAANDVDLRLSPVFGADRLVELAAGDYRVRLRVPGLATGTISTAADRLAFSGVGTDPGFEIIPTPEGFEFRAILADATTSSEVRVALQTVGLTPSIRPDGTIDLADPAGKPIGRISAPAVIDAAGEFAPADAVTTTLLDRKAGDPIRDSLPSIDPADLDASAGLAPADNMLRADEVVVAYAIDPVSVDHLPGDRDRHPQAPYRHDV